MIWKYLKRKLPCQTQFGAGKVELSVPRKFQISQRYRCYRTLRRRDENLEEARKIIGTFKDMMLNKGDDLELSEELEDLEALQGVKQYPVRIKCALLPWNTLLEGLESLESKESKSHAVEVRE